MPQVLASGKTGSQRYEDLNATKPCPDLDDITLIQNFQNSYEETQGYSLCNNKGNGDSIDSALDDITLANVADYNKNLSQLIQTYVANNSYLDVDADSTANNIILVPRKIANINSPNGTNYSKATSLPFTYRNNLRFAFRATANNLAATQFTITGLAGLVGPKDLVNEAGSSLVGGEIISGRFYEIVLTGTGGTQKGILVGASRVVAASESAAGIAEIATQAEANAATDDTRILTALKAGLLQRPTFSAYLSSSPALSASTETRINFNTETWDNNSWYDNATNYRFTPLRAGYYLIDATIRNLPSADHHILIETRIRKNGTIININSVTGRANATPTCSANCNAIINMNGTTDYIDVAAFSTGTGTIQGGAGNTLFSAIYLGGL